MRAHPTPLPGVLEIEPHVHGDDRGFFFEAWNARTWLEAIGHTDEFVQDNHSRSHRNVLRGVHYQVVEPQGKLVRVVTGTIWDVAVDLRRGSPTFRRWYGTRLSGENHRMLWVPPGFGHGLLTLSDTADVLYKTTAFYAAEHDRAVRYDDPELAIEWPLDGAEPILSAKDVGAPGLADAELFA